MLAPPSNRLLLLVWLAVGIVKCCVHDQLTQNATFTYLDEQTHTQGRPVRMARLLQDMSAFTILDSASATTSTTTSTTTNATTSTTTSVTTSSTVAGIAPRDKLRIFADYTQVLVGDAAAKNVIKRVVNISANYYYNTLKVDRLQRLYFPSNVPLKCNVLNVPTQYVQNGTIGDVGILVGNEDNNETYVGRSVSCTLLKSTNRPIWGVIIFNNRNLGYGQIQFQKIVFVAVHEMTHVLGFSSALFPLFPAGNPFYTDANFMQYLRSPKILTEIKNHFNCSTSMGLPLEDQDGTVNSSHNERKVLGNEFMIAMSKKQAFVSRFTLALLDSTGWYDVNYTYAEPTGWGKNKGCSFLNIDICSSEEFCPRAASSTSLQLNCDWDGTAYGSCVNDPFAGSCNTVNYYTNTICLEQSYELTALTASMKAKEKGGYNSRCFNSSIRTSGIAPSIINFRCYLTICGSSSPLVYVKIDSYILMCRNAGQDIAAPFGMEGTLRCPNYAKYCTENKRTCAYHCNKNGICINGMCLCTGATVLTATCIDESNLTTTIEDTAGLTRSIIIDSGDVLNLVNSRLSRTKVLLSRSEGGSAVGRTSILYTKKSINTKCMLGTYFDKQFGECVKCSERFKCESCTQAGCDGPRRSP